MKKNKTIIIITIAVIYLIALFVVLIGSKSNQRKDKNLNKKYIVVDDFAKLSYSGGAWSNASTSDIESYKEYNVFINNELFGKYRLEYGNTWNLFNDSDDYVNYEGSLFAYSDNFDVKLNNMERMTLSDDDKSVISKYFNYNDYSNLITSDVFKIDMDDDGINDKIICLSNIGLDDNKASNYYNLIFIISNDKIIKILNENSSNSDIMESAVYNLVNVFEFNDKKYLVVKKTMGIDSDGVQESTVLYQSIDNNSFEKVKFSS